MILALLSGVAHAKVRPVSFTSEGGKLHGYVVMPATGRAVAGVIMVHGSGPDGADDYLSQAQAFADGGVAVLVYDKRGWNRSGGDWKRRPFALLAADAINAARTLRAHAKVPDERVGYWGVSQGGWVIAESAARDPDTAFVIGVAATSVSPISQELWHKEQMMVALGYSPKARAIALDFWRLAFDFMVKVDRGTIPLPDTILVNERAGASTGLDFDPLPWWSKVRAPVLLLYGEKDLLEPAPSSARMISASLARSASHAAVIFPAASHTITTRQTGLVFDWGEAFHPAYYPLMLRWIRDGVLPSGVQTVALGPTEADKSSFAQGGIYGEATTWRSASLQLPLLLALPILLTWSGAASCLRLRKRTTKLDLLGLFVAVGGLLTYAGFVAFLANSVFTQGLLPMDHYEIATCQRLLPIAGSVVGVTAALTVGAWLFGHRQHVLGPLSATIFLIWAATWSMVGRPL